MLPSLLPRFFIISALSTIICSTYFSHANSQCLDDQKTLLLQLNNELTFKPNHFLRNNLVHWNQTDDCCNWEGVECDDAGHVIGLQRDREGISGRIDNDSTLFNLRYLKKLNLAWSSFNGSQIPRAIGNLTYLTHLNLSYADFGGQVPVELSYLIRLVSLDISWNQYIEPLNEHFNLTMLLQNLTGLRELYLDRLDLSIQGSEWCQVISSSLPHLKILSLSGCSLKGSFPKEIFQIPTLEELDLSSNKLLNETLPRFPESRALRSVVLSSTGLSGSLPDSFNNISMLSHIDLSHCNFSGPIPPTLANLTELVRLDLSNNSFTGLFPPCYVLKRLTYIDLSLNNLNGSLTSMHFEGLSNLSYVDLGSNLLSGSIPLNLLGLPSLERLMLYNNRFNGTLQLNKIPRFYQILYLDLSYNNLSVDASNISSSSTFPKLRFLYLASCRLYKIPDFLKQSDVMYLDLSDNGIVGEIPSWIWEIGNGGLQFLNLSCNLLVDLQKPYQIPPYLGVLDLHSNLLQGDLFLPIPPPDVEHITPFLSSLYLANNNLTGSIPTSLCNAITLQAVDLSFNALSGNIPPCLIENTESLTVLILGRNNISGDIPDEFPVSCDLEALDLSNNNLGGNVPKSLANCKSLELMNVGNNNMDGSFPCMLPSSLRLLVLHSNRFHGDLTCLHNSWPNLQIIDIASNNLSGSLYPVNFSSWGGMMEGSRNQELMLNRLGYVVGYRNEYYQNEVTLTIKGQERNLIKIWGYYATLDFSSNNFQGSIPDGIAHLGSLYLLNLSHNALMGSIPASFGKLRQLGSMDLSANQLTGVIPKEIAGLNFLSTLNLSHNKLVGVIPNGPQFQTFSKDSFGHNMGLCGFPLNISCSNNTDENHASSPDHAKSENEWDYISVALGFVVGLGGFVWVLLCCRNLRQKYYGKVDEILEKILKHGDKNRRAVKNQLRRQ